MKPELAPATAPVYFWTVVQVGKVQQLRVLRRSRNGWILGDEDDVEAFFAGDLQVDGTEDRFITVFVHTDRDGNLIATTTLPKAQAGGFAPMQVAFVDHKGAHVDWGLEPELLVPHQEQEREMFEGNWYVVRVIADPVTGRLTGSTRIAQFLQNNELSVAEGDSVDLLVHSKSDLGYSVIVNDRHHGLVHANEVFKEISVGDRATGHVKRIREDNKLDISLQPIGFRQFNDVNVQLLIKKLKANKGFLPFTDNSSAEEIHREFGISKKAFKKALGALYKQRKVKIQDDGVLWMDRK